jgi:hypothetical protein
LIAVGAGPLARKGRYEEQERSRPAHGVIVREDGRRRRPSSGCFGRTRACRQRRGRP